MKVVRSFFTLVCYLHVYVFQIIQSRFLSGLCADDFVFIPCSMQKKQAVSSLCFGELKRPSNKIHIFTCLLKDVEVGGGDEDDGEGGEDEEVERIAVLVECVLCHLCFSNLSLLAGR